MEATDYESPCNWSMLKDASSFGPSQDLFEFQDRISKVAGAIHPAIRNKEIELAKRKPPRSLRAYDLVMRPYPHLCGHNKVANNLASPLLREAIALDPAYGRAHACLAMVPSPEHRILLIRRAGT